MASVPADPSRCPLCGRANECGAAAGTAATCWCITASGPRWRLQDLPADNKHFACMCQRCATGTYDRWKTLEDFRRRQQLFRKWR
ncbi:MAG: cysteine-rich CWC family protein [Candidatus Rokuibacteriota bacterium]